MKGTPIGRRYAGALRENMRLRNALVEMVTAEEQITLDSDWPWADHKGPPRLCAVLAPFVDPETFDMLKRARRALGLPWWGGLDYRNGLQPGKGRAA